MACWTGLMNRSNADASGLVDSSPTPIADSMTDDSTPASVVALRSVRVPSPSTTGPIHHVGRVRSDRTHHRVDVLNRSQQVLRDE